MYRLEIDAETGIAVTYVSGFMQMEEAKSFCADIWALAQDAHRKTGRFRFLTVSEDAQHASPSETIGEFRQLAEKLYGLPDYRGAYVIESALVRMQAARLSDSERVKPFSSVSEAKEWLLK